MRHLFARLTAVLASWAALGAQADAKTTAAPRVAQAPLSWTTLPELPDALGVGGPFVGTHGSQLIVAGGANFPAAPPWEGGQKVWHANVWLLGTGEDATWRRGPSLTRPLAYGAAVSHASGMLLIGGLDADRCYAEVVRLAFDSETKTLTSTTLPALPRPSGFHSAAAIGDRVFVAAGQADADPTSVKSEFWVLDLQDLPGGWRALPAWPASPRIKTVAAVQGDGQGERFYLFGGEYPTADGRGGVARAYPRDAFVYHPGESRWTAIAPAPASVAAACAAPLGQSHIVIFSGAPGPGPELPIESRPTFAPTIRAYHTVTNTWVEAGEMPTGVVTSGAVWWNDQIVVASGEIRPGVRTRAVQAARPVSRESSFGLVNYLVLVLYLLTLVGMGAYFSRREAGTDDFFLAGQRIPWWAAGISIYATQLSAITFIATPALAFSTNWTVWPLGFTILLMAPVVVRFFLPFFRRLNITTAYGYLERRFDGRTRMFGSLSFILFQLGRMAIVVYLPALALAAITGIDVYASILIMGVLATIYTVLGGMEAVIWTDVFQTFVLFGGMLFSLAVIMFDLGGFLEPLETASAAHKLDMLAGSMSFTELATWSVLLGGFLLNFAPYTADQAVVQRYLTTKDESAAARGVWLNGLLAVPGLLCFYALGTFLWLFFRAHPEEIAVGMKNDEVFPLFVAEHLPAGISGLVIAGVFAASMSSLDSSMHSIATAFTEDFYKRFKKNRTPAGDLRVARAVTLSMGVVGTGLALVLASYDIQSLFLFFQKVLGLLGSGLVAIFLLGIFTRRANGPGVILGALASAVVMFFVTQYSPVHAFVYPIVGIGTGLAVGYGASLFFPSTQHDIDGLTYRSLQSE